MNITSIELVPSYENISVYINFTGPAGAGDYAELRYRSLGGSWRRAHDMVIDLRTTVLVGYTTYQNLYVNQFRGVILKVPSNTEYEVEATIFSSYAVTGSVPYGTVKTLNDNPQANGSEIYASPTGNDANSGADSNNAKTLQGCLDVAIPGTNILLLPGTHHSVSPLVFPRSGQVDNYIKLRPAFADDRPIISSDGEWGGIDFNGAEYIMLQELETTNTRTRFQCLNLENCRGIIFEDIYCLVKGTQWWSSAFMVGEGARDCLISNLEAIAPSVGYDGPYAVMWGTPNGAANRLTIRDGKFSGFWDATGGEGNFEIPGGFFRDSFMYRCKSDGSSDDAFEVEGAAMCCGLYENDLNTSRRYGLGISAAGLGPLFNVRSTLRNIGDGAYKMGGSSGRIFSYHNNIYGGEDGYESGGSGSHLKGLTSKNNIVHVNRYILENYMDTNADWVFDYDCMMSGRGENGLAFKWNDVQVNLSQLRSQYGQEIHGIWADPMWVNPVSGNFTLQPNSPCIDVGVIIPGINDVDSPWPYSGAAPDIGAFESDGVAPPLYTLTIQVTEGVTTTHLQPGDHEIIAGSTVQVTAKPFEGYRFSQWTGAVTSINNPLVLLVNSDVIITAVFVEGTAPPTGIDLNALVSAVVVISMLSMMAKTMNPEGG